MTGPDALRMRAEEARSPGPEGESATTAKGTDLPVGPEQSLHEKILTEFVARLRQHQHVGDPLASAIASLVQGPKVPKRELIAQTVRKALDAGEGSDGSTA